MHLHSGAGRPLGVPRLDGGRILELLHVPGPGLDEGQRHRHVRSDQGNWHVDRVDHAAQCPLRRHRRWPVHRVPRQKKHYSGHRLAIRSSLAADRPGDERRDGPRRPSPLRLLRRHRLALSARLSGGDDPGGGARHPGPPAHRVREHRNSALLRRGHVPRLEKSRAPRRQPADPVHDSDVHHSRDTEMVHLQGEDQAGAKVVAVAARQGHRHHRRADRGGEAARRERAQRLAGGVHGAVQEEPSEAAAHLAGLDVLPAAVRHQRRHILHGANIQGRREQHRREPVHHHSGHRELRLDVRRGRRDRQARPKDAALHQRRIDVPDSVHVRHVLLREGRGRRRNGVRLDTAAQPDRLRDRILARLRPDPLADDGRDPAGEDPRLGRERRDRVQLDVHVRRDENVRGHRVGDRPVRNLLDVRRDRPARLRVRDRLRAGDAGQVPRGDREEIRRPGQKNERGREHEAYADGLLTVPSSPSRPPSFPRLLPRPERESPSRGEDGGKGGAGGASGCTKFRLARVGHPRSTRTPNPATFSSPIVFTGSTSS